MDGSADRTSPCPRCHGVGTLLISLCCGRGCTNCVGDGMRQIDCHRCNGSGVAAVEPPTRPVQPR